MTIRHRIPCLPSKGYKHTTTLKIFTSLCQLRKPHLIPLRLLFLTILSTSASKERSLITYSTIIERKHMTDRLH
ncbi:uncharacterized protein L969DRAFT_117354 [Mixia osmundae IAM 14324]|uniref:Uncharacterized protein n=1 Tax=Mixia osmundae (strain CBS 9802 / IAM 14324 / JCM 22182 / KY 12970) TaxID=764103 RepID=G7E798_MIXOS|nr:uncharacterized protein L969DRAFT_117354 [Mixia osmundae IAM 14324]KEI41898.1 hypothetical protein L969DRAFT_117354 [Mixia osmundae IAM 14324]GAA98708.1 hypothetical protein E5Q_05396 [Mixia osmundae IAM 14324]